MASIPTSPGYCGFTLENITIGCGQNCAATRAYCGHAQTEKLKTTASTASAAMRRPFLTAMSFCQITSSPAMTSKPSASSRLTSCSRNRRLTGSSGRLKEMTAVAEVEDADADFTGLEVLEHCELSEVTESTKQLPTSNTE